MAQSADNSRARFAAVDLAKLVAAAAVVWIHVTDCDEAREYLPLWRFAVPFFTCAAVYFVLQKVASDPTGRLSSYCAQRARRLYLPFILWSVLYLGIRAVKHLLV